MPMWKDRDSAVAGDVNLPCEDVSFEEGVERWIWLGRGAKTTSSTCEAEYEETFDAASQDQG